MPSDATSGTRSRQSGPCILDRDAPATTMDPTFIRTVTLLREQVPDFNRYPFNLPVVRELEGLELSFLDGRPPKRLW